MLDNINTNQILLLLENIENENTEFDKVDGSDENEFDEVGYLNHNSDFEQSLYEDNVINSFSNWSNGPQFVGKDGRTFWKFSRPQKMLELDDIILPDMYPE